MSLLDQYRVIIHDEGVVCEGSYYYCCGYASCLRVPHSIVNSNNEVVPSNEVGYS